MGYDVHITRKAEWSVDEGDNIELSEWEAYVSSDPDVEIISAAEANMPDGVVLGYENEGLAVWTAPLSAEQAERNKAWIDYRNGRLVVKNPDIELLRKMYSIAGALGARVQGDEGEFYDANGEVISLEAGDGGKKKPWWRFW